MPGLQPRRSHGCDVLHRVRHAVARTLPCLRGSQSTSGRICGDCGGKLAGRAASAAQPLSPSASPPNAITVNAERRQLTVIFCDLVGSTDLSARLDPEDLRDVIGAYRGRVADAVARFDGFLAGYPGDGVLVYFGYPRSHEDDAERAVRAGLAAVAAVRSLSTGAGIRLQARVGIATGLVVVGEQIGVGETQQVDATGETPNLAARLQALAEPGEVVIAANTRRLVGRMFDCRALGAIEIKGLPQPVETWQVLGESAGVSRFEAMHADALSPLVGRQEEIELLLRRWDQAKAGEGRIALLSGEPGIGKSRIAESLLARLGDEAHVRLRYFCSPYHAHSALYPFIAQLEQAAGFELGSDAGARLDKLEALLKLTAKNVARDVALIAELLEVPADGRYPALQVSPQQKRELTLTTLLGQLDGVAAQRPLLIVFEDAHWIDPTSLDLLNRIVARVADLPVLLIITCRPEFQPTWVGQPHVTMLPLSRLGRRDGAGIIAGITKGKALPDAVAEQILARADGVPLFIEELTSTMLESGLLREITDRYALDGPLPPLAIPTTLRAALVARLDRLASVKGASIKEIAQIGAALGREFSYRLIAAVAPTAGAPLETALAQLGAAELIFARGEPPGSTYIFKHALVQEAAHASLLHSERQRLHGQITDALNEHFPEIIESHPELMAHHLAEAGLTERAIEYLQKAGERAIQRSANIEAIAHLKRALELLQLLPDHQGRTRKTLELVVLLGQAMIAGRGYAAAETKEVLRRAKALIDESTDLAQKFSILYGIWACHYVGGEVALQRDAAADFLREAERHGDTAALCLSHRALGATYVTMGEFAAGRQHLERARALYGAEEHARLRYQYGQDIGVTALCYLSWALWHLGYFDQASEVAAEALRRAEEISHPHTQVYTICHARGMLDIFRRRHEETRSYAGLVVALSVEHGFPFWAAGGRILNGWAATCQGETELGIDLLRDGVTAWRKTGARLWLPIFLALEADAHAKAGHSDTALQVIDEAILISEETGERWAIAEVLRIKASLLLATGRPFEEGEALLVNSLEIARHQQARSWELRTACDLARLWQHQGRGGEALQLVRTIYDQFTEGFDTADLRDAKALLAHGTETRLTRDLANLEQKVRVPSGAFSACFDAADGFVVTDKVEGEAADDDHVLGVVAGP